MTIFCLCQSLFRFVLLQFSVSVSNTLFLSSSIYPRSLAICLTDRETTEYCLTSAKLAINAFVQLTIFVFLSLLASVWSSKQCDQGVMEFDAGCCCYLCFVHWRTSFFNINNGFVNYMHPRGWVGQGRSFKLLIFIHPFAQSPPHKIKPISFHFRFWDFVFLAFAPTQDCHSGRPEN